MAEGKVEGESLLEGTPRLGTGVAAVVSEQQQQQQQQLWPPSWEYC